LVSGYTLLGATSLYTFASVPLALHYLSKQEIGLWGVVTQIAGYLTLVDLGMAGSISRILIDHKDNPADGTYGDVIKTGTLVLLVQGVIIIFLGVCVSIFLPDLFGVALVHRRPFQILVAGHCAILGAFFVGRLSNHLLLAHQRFDAWNYAQIVGLFANFALMWVGLASGWGLYSLLAGSAAATLASTILALAAAARLKLFPPAHAPGRANLDIFRQLFTFGREVFLVSVGTQLVSASQLLVISRTVGFESAGIWSIATKPFAMAQQVVSRVLDYAAAGLAEMLVRGERDRLLERLRDVVIVSASFAVWVGLAVALCNHDFLALWTKKRVIWDTSSDWLMGLSVICYSTTRCFTGFIGVTKRIRAMKYMYPLEGVAFVGLSLLTVRALGMNAIITTALLTNVLCSGLYGLFRTKHYFNLPDYRALLAWLRSPSLCLLSLGALFGALGWADAGWSPVPRLVLNAALAGSVGLALFLRLGLSPHLRAEALGPLAKLRARLRPHV
jgi:O-antigen/teichoic acid export membrane protein